MNALTNVTNDPNQVLTVILDDGTGVQINLVYRPAIQRWTMDLNHNDTFLVDGINISVFPNLLQPWKEFAGFGIGCTTLDGADPIYLDDFSNGRATLYVLNEADVEAINATYLGVGV